MSGAGLALAVIGALLLVGLVADWTSTHLPVPRVSVLILLGVLAGPIGLDLLPPDREVWFPIVSAVALVMVGFLIGGELTVDRVRDLGREAGGIAVIQAVVTSASIGGGLVLLGVDVRVALPLAGVAAATDATAVVGVVQDREQDRGRRSPFATLLLAVITLDDALSLVLFSVLIAVTDVLSGAGNVGAAGRVAAWELGGAVVLGLVLGIPGALLSGRLKEGQPLLEEALGLVLLCAGIGLWLDVSFLLSAVVMGVVIANVAGHHERTFRQIEGIEWPFLVVFFVLAGASLEITALAGAGLAVVAYIVLRTVGKVAGGWLGATVADSTRATARWMGPALLPQAGVALGLALLAEEQLPEVGSEVVAIVVASTVVFELAGPLFTRLAISRAA